MKKILSLLTLITSFSYSQNPKKMIGYERSYYTNEDLLSLYSDKLSMEYDFTNNYTLKSDISLMTLNQLQFGNYDSENIQRLYSLDFTVEKKIILKNSWDLNFGINPQVRSNFISSLNSNDFLINGYIATNKEFKDKSTLLISAVYGTLFGKPKPYLEFAYTLRANDKMNFSIGFPKTYIEYNINKSNSFTLLSNYESYYTTLSKNSYSRVLEGQILNYRSLHFSKINTVVMYKYKFSDNSIVDFSIGKSFENQLKIKESNNQQTKEQFNNRFTIAMGFKCNLNFK